MKIALKNAEFDKIDEWLAKLPLTEADTDEVKEIKALTSFAKEISNAQSITELETTLSQAENTELRYLLACSYAANSDFKNALDNFLLVLQEDRSYKNDGARKSMIAIFDLLGGAGPVVNQYRIKMSKLLH